MQASERFLLMALYGPEEFMTGPQFLTARYGKDGPAPEQKNLARLALTTHVHNSHHFFASQFCYVADKRGKLTLLKPFVGQAILRYSLDTQLRNELPGRICEVKARQVGWTIENISRLLHFCLDENRIGLILVDDEEIAAAQATRLGTMLNGLPSWLQPMRRIQNIKHLVFDNPNPKERAKNPGLNSEAKITVPAAFRGIGGSICAIISEYAHMLPDRQESIQQGLVSAIPLTSDTIVVFDTTPNGEDESYAPMVRKSVEANPKWTKRIEEWKGELDPQDVLNGILGEPDVVAKGYPGKLIPAICPWRLHPEYSAKCATTPLGMLRPMTKAQKNETLDSLGKISLYGGEEELELRDKYGVCLERLWWRRRTIDQYELPTEEMRLLTFRQEYLSCIASGQRVSTSDGFIPIEKVRTGAATPEGRVENVHDFGIKSIVELTTYAGRKLRCTPNHWIFTTEGEFQADNLLGKSVVLQRPDFAEKEYTLSYTGFANTQVSLKITEDWGRFLGHYMADGCFYGGTINFATDARDKEVSDDICSLIQELLGIAPNVRVVRDHCRVIQASNKRLIELFGALGIIGDVRYGKIKSLARKRKVCVPEVIWRSPKHVVRAFLKAYFEGDGWRSPSGGTVKSFAKDPDFCRDIQHLLLGFGINCYLATNIKHMKNGDFSGCELRMRTIGSKRFIEEIGFISHRKSFRLALEKPKRGKGIGRPAQDFTTEDKVISITPLSEPAHVWDLTIEGRHRYGVRGLTVHNTVESSFIDSGTAPFDRGSLDVLGRMERTPFAVGLFRSEGEFEHWEMNGEGITNVHRDPNPWEQIRLYAPPENGEQYTMGIDTDLAYESPDSDATVAQVVRARDNKIVCTYEARVPSYLLVKQLKCIYRWYNNCYYAVELVGMGYDLQRACMAAGMTNVHYWKRYDSDNPEPSKYPGWETNHLTRPLMDQLLLELLCHRNPANGKPDPLLNIPDATTIREIRGLSRGPTGSFKSARGHDDHVDSYLIATCIARDPYSGIIRKQQETEAQKREEFEKTFRWLANRSGDGGSRNRPDLATL